MTINAPVAGRIYIDTRDLTRSRFTGDRSVVYKSYYIMYSLPGRKRYYVPPGQFRKHFLEASA